MLMLIQYTHKDKVLMVVLERFEEESDFVDGFEEEARQRRICC